MKNHVKSLISGAMLIVMLASTALTSFALPMNTDITDNYIYDYYGVSIKAPVAYKAEKVLAGGYVDKTVVMGVRPEAVHDEQMYLEAYQDSQFESKIEVVELLGSESLIYMMLENTNFIARVKPRNNIYVGDTMRFAINPNKVHVFDKETENIVTN